jgi:hypothetical protein
VREGVLSAREDDRSRRYVPADAVDELLRAAPDRPEQRIPSYRAT